MTVISQNLIVNTSISVIISIIYNNFKLKPFSTISVTSTMSRSVLWMTQRPLYAGQLLPAERHHFTGEIYPNLCCFSGVDWCKHSANEDKIVILLPDQCLLASLKETVLQTQKAPLVSAVVSQKMPFFTGNSKHKKVDSSS
jgi:hypothetical protein